MNSDHDETLHKGDVNDEIWELEVPDGQNKMRLDQYVANKLEKKTRSQIQKLIKEGDITVDNKTVKPSYQVVGGERILINLPPPKQSDLLPENIPLDIVYEDKSIIIVNKNPGMVVHPAYGNLSGTLVNALIFHCQQLSEINGEFRPGIVHRLDKNTSGLLIIAKNDFVHSQLSSQFSNRTINREYRAIVWGHLKENHGRIETLINRSSKDRTRMVVAKQGKIAITNYEIIEEYSIASLLKIKLETGRTHQIRVHLSSIGHPVVGDDTYGGRNKQIINLNQKNQRLAREILNTIPRQALHAKTIGFFHPETETDMSFDSEIPFDMKKILNLLSQYKQS